jgi:hypothetical protein
MRRLTLGAVLTVSSLVGCGTSTVGGADPPRDDSAERRGQAAAALEGTWSGDSRCQVPGSPCRDEKAVYRVYPPTKDGKVPVNFAKVVDGKAVPMGTLNMDFDPRERTLTCKYSQGVWQLKVDGTAMTGTLTTNDNVVYRRVSLRKQEK